MTTVKRVPRRGEIWFLELPSDPSGKGIRPVVIVSLDARNRHERADTVLVIPLTTSIHKNAATHLFLAAGDSGLSVDCAARAEDITVVRKQSLMEPRIGVRQLSNSQICELATMVSIAMGCGIWE